MPLFLFIGIILLAGCKKDDDKKEDQTKEIFLGAILPLDVAVGESHIAALQTAVDEINEDGKVLDGYTIKLDVRSSEPTGADPRDGQALIMAKDLLNTHSLLVGYVTTVSSSSKKVALEVADPQHIPQISLSSTSDANSGLSDYFHRLAAPDKFQTVIMAQKAKEYGINTVSIAVLADNEYSQGIADGFEENFTAMGGTVLRQVTFVENDTNYYSNIENLYEGNPDAVVTAMIFISKEFLNQVNDNAFSLGLNENDLRFIFTDSQYGQNILSQAPVDLLTGTVNGFPRTFGTYPSPDVSNPSYVHFKAQLKNRYNLDPIPFNAQCYDIIYLYALAMERALKEGVNVNNIDLFREAVNNNLRKVSRNDNGEIVVKPEEGWNALQAAAKNGDVNYTGASGNCDIDENGDVITNYNVFKIIDDGAGTLSFEDIENVDPLDMK